MGTEQPRTALDSADGNGCARCGALIAETGVQRHEAWHDFLEGSITGLTADLAALDPPPFT